MTQIFVIINILANFCDNIIYIYIGYRIRRIVWNKNSKIIITSNYIYLNKLRRQKHNWQVVLISWKWNKRRIKHASSSWSWGKTYVYYFLINIVKLCHRYFTLFYYQIPTQINILTWNWYRIVLTNLFIIIIKKKVYHTKSIK